MGQLYTDALLSNATSVQISRALYNTSKTEDSLDSNLFVVHHMCHAWIPKRCYGDGFFPFSWELVPVIDRLEDTSRFYWRSLGDSIGDSIVIL
jgi:hypothetical protein